MSASLAIVSFVGFRRHHFTTHVAVAATFALLSALAFAVATVAQHRAAAEVSDAHARSSQFVGQLIRRPQWWAGTMGNTVGYVLQGVALAYGSLLVVQPLLVTSLLFALPMGAHLAHRMLPPSVWAWGLVLALSLIVFVSAGHPNNGANHASHRAWLIVSAIGVPVVVLSLVFAHGRTGATRASMLAVSVGVLGGVLAVLTKAVVALIRFHGVLSIGTAGETYGLLAVGLVGLYVQQLSFQAGALQASLPIILVLEPVVAAVLGLTLLHEQLRVTGFRMGLLALAVAAMAVATVALARDAADLEASLAPPGPPAPALPGA